MPPQTYNGFSSDPDATNPPAGNKAPGNSPAWLYGGWFPLDDEGGRGKTLSVCVNVPARNGATFWDVGLETTPNDGTDRNPARYDEAAVAGPGTNEAVTNGKEWIRRCPLVEGGNDIANPPAAQFTVKGLMARLKIRSDNVLAVGTARVVV